MPVIIIVFTYFGHILQNLLYFRIFNNKYIEMAFKDIKIMLLRSENHHQVFKITYYYVFTYFGHIFKNLLYFRIFNNKYIEMAVKDIKIMLCRIFKKKNKAKHPQYSVLSHMKTT